MTNQAKQAIYSAFVFDVRAAIGKPPTLTGSRAVGKHTDASDYDCWIVNPLHSGATKDQQDNFANVLKAWGAVLAVGTYHRGSCDVYDIEKVIHLIVVDPSQVELRIETERFVSENRDIWYAADKASRRLMWTAAYDMFVRELQQAENPPSESKPHKPYGTYKLKP